MNNNPDTVLTRFAALFGAIVTVTRVERGRYLWSCGGCGDSGEHSVLGPVRTGANDHAGRCRALPQE